MHILLCLTYTNYFSLYNFSFDLKILHTMYITDLQLLESLNTFFFLNTKTTNDFSQKHDLVTKVLLTYINLYILTQQDYKKP